MARSVGKSVLGAAGIIAILTVFSRLAGLLRKLAQSWALSDGAVASAYDTANTVPNVLFEVAAGGALAGAVIPLIAGYVAQQRSSELNQTLSALISWILLIGIPVSLLVIVAATPISATLFGSETDESVVRLAAILLQLFALQIPLYGLSVVFTGALQAHGKFVLPALSPLLSSLVVIGMFLLYTQYFGHQVSPHDLSLSGVLLLGIGTTGGVVIFSLPQLIPLRKKIRLRLTLHFPPRVARKALALAGAGLAALLAQQLAIVAIMFVANSAGGIGTYTTFNYAYTVFMVPYGVLCVPIATAVFPKIAAAVAQNQQQQTVLLVQQSTQIVLLMGAAATSVLIALARPAKIVLEVGRDIASLDFAMQMMAGGLIGFSLLYHVARVLYACGEGRKVILQNSVAWGAVCLCIAIFFNCGVSGREDTLAAIGGALTIGLSIGAVFTLISLLQVFGHGALGGMAKTLFITVLILTPVTWISTQIVEWIIAKMDGTIFSAFVAAIAGGSLILAVTLLIALISNSNLIKLIRRK